MAASNLDASNLLAVLEGGLIPEDLFKQVFDVSQTDMEFTQRASTGSHKAPFFDWTMDRLQVQNLTNAVVDGADIDQQDAVRGQRVTNHSQISVKEVQVSTRANTVDVVGAANEISRQITQRTQELMRDLEGIALLNQAAVQDDGTAAGNVGGLEAWIDGKILVPTESGAIAGTGVQTDARTSVESAGSIAGGGWDNRASPGKILPAWAYAGVTPGGITETVIKDAVTALYKNTNSRANRVLMTRPDLHNLISDFYFEPSSRVASLTAETNQQGPAQAMIAVNSILTNYGVLDMVPNALQPQGDAGSGSDTAFILDFSQISFSFLHGFRTEPLAKTGLSTKMLISVDWSLRIDNSEALGMIQGIDDSIAMVA